MLQILAGAADGVALILLLDAHVKRVKKNADGVAPDVLDTCAPPAPRGS